MLDRMLMGAAEDAAAGVKLYVEDVFSPYLYTGNSTTKTITNGIDLADKGGLVWIKVRGGTNGQQHNLYDTARGPANVLWLLAIQNLVFSNGLTSFNSAGFSLSDNPQTNFNADNFVSWTFRKAPKFFDIVTWTGNGVSGRQISHNLGSVPGMIIVKSTIRPENWNVYHRSLGNTGLAALNTSDAAVTGSGVWGSTTPTATNFTVSADNLVNSNGDGYVAYIFAHEAGGFGNTGVQNGISCGSYTGNGSSQTINCAFAAGARFVMIKRTNSTGDWYLWDTARGIVAGNDPHLSSNNTEVEVTSNDTIDPNSSGFVVNQVSATNVNVSSATYIYLAIA